MWSANEWIELVRNMPKRDNLIEDLLVDALNPHEYMLIAGRTGIGKTNLALHLAYCLATGTPFFGLKCKRTTVGYIGFEGTITKMVDRLEKISQNFPDPGDNLRFELCSPFVLDRKLSEFEGKVAGCRVIFLDPLRYLVTGDYCKPSDAIRFISLLDRELAKLKATAIVVHHIRKPNQLLLIDPGDLYQMKGAAEYADAATSVLMLERTRQRHNPGGGFARVDPDNVTLYFAKHRDAVGELKPIELHFNRNKLLFEPK
jgi:RecA-family ATPase